MCLGLLLGIFKAPWIPWEAPFNRHNEKLNSKSVKCNVLYLFRRVLEAILPNVDNLPLSLSRLWLEVVLVSRLESCRTISKLCRGMYNKPSSLGSAKGFNNDELKLLVKSVPLENQFAAIPIKWRRHTAAMLNAGWRLVFICKITDPSSKNKLFPFSFARRYKENFIIKKVCPHLQNRFFL